MGLETESVGSFVSLTPCGDAFCEGDEFCCNESCSICAPVVGGTCTLQVCDGAPEVGEPCGETVCGLGEICCEPACGQCAVDLDACPEVPCDQLEVIPCGDGYCAPGATCVNAQDGQPACVSGACGDGVVVSGEACDLGAMNGAVGSPCRAGCVLATCGDGIPDAVIGAEEACDQGAANDDLSASACRRDCQTARCGDGIINDGERGGCLAPPQAFAPGFDPLGHHFIDLDGDHRPDALSADSRASGAQVPFLEPDRPYVTVGLDPAPPGDPVPYVGQGAGEQPGGWAAQAAAAVAAAHNALAPSEGLLHVAERWGEEVQLQRHPGRKREFERRQRRQTPSASLPTPAAFAGLLAHQVALFPYQLAVGGLPPLPTHCRRGEEVAVRQGLQAAPQQVAMEIKKV